MKNFLRKYGLMILVDVLLLGYMLYGVFQSNAQLQDSIKLDKEVKYQYCLNHTIDEFSNEQEKELYKNLCDNLNDEEYRSNFYILYTSYFEFNYLRKIILYMFLILIIPTAFQICSKLKNNYLKHYLTRNTYKKFKNEIRNYAYLNAFIIFFMFFICFLLCALLTRNFDIVSPESYGLNTLGGTLSYIGLRSFKIFCALLTYVNIFLIFARKNHNPIIAILTSILFLLAVQIFIEFNRNLYAFQFMDMSNITTPTEILLTSLFWLITTSIIVYLRYRNKEKLLIDCEKNK